MRYLRALALGVVCLAVIVGCARVVQGITYDVFDKEGKKIGSVTYHQGVWVKSGALANATMQDFRVIFDKDPNTGMVHVDASSITDSEGLSSPDVGKYIMDAAGNIVGFLYPQGINPPTPQPEPAPATEVNVGVNP